MNASKLHLYSNLNGGQRNVQSKKYSTNLQNNKQHTPCIGEKCSQKNSIEMSDLKIRVKRFSFGGDDPCYENGLCVNNKGNKIVCYCDKFCRHFGDCCYDTVVNKQPNELPNLDLFQCERYRANLEYTIRAWTVVKCPNAYSNQFVKIQCLSREKLINDVPVFDQNGILYANAYCAICNNATDYVTSDLIYVLHRCFSKYTSNFNVTVLSQDSCAKRYRYYEPPKDFNLRYCSTSINRNITTSSLTCTYYQSPIYYDGAVVKSMYCTNDPFRPHLCIDSIVVKEQTFFFIYDMFPLTVLFSFSKPGIYEDSSFCQLKESTNMLNVSILLLFIVVPR